MVQSVATWKSAQATPAPVATPGVTPVSEWAKSLPPKKPGIVQRVGQFLFGNQIAKDVASAITAPAAPKSLNQQEALKSGWDTISRTIQDTAKRFQALSSANTPTDKIVATGEAAMGLINNAFLGISAPLNALRGEPGIGYVADGLSNLFGAISAGGADIASAAVNALPLPDTTKNKILPLAREAGALVAQIAAGKVGGDAVSGVADKAKAIMVHVNDGLDGARSVVESGYRPLPVTDASTPAPVIPRKITDIQFGPTVSRKTPLQTDLPTIPGLKYEPVSQETPPATFPAPTEVGKPSRSTSTVKPLKGTGEEKLRGLAKKVAASNVEQGIQQDLADLPTYRTLNVKDQATKAAEFANNDFETAKFVAMGEKTAPKGIAPESVFVAVENAAKLNGDYQTLSDLAHSHLTAQATTFGQRLRLLAERGDSPTEIIRSINEARQASLAKNGIDVSKEADSIRSEVRRSASKSATRESWSAFIDTLKCNY